METNSFSLTSKLTPFTAKKELCPDGKDFERFSTLRISSMGKTIILRGRIANVFRVKIKSMPLIDNLPKGFEPDIENLKAVLRNERPEKVPLFELSVSEKVLSELTGVELSRKPERVDREGIQEWARRRIRAFRLVGFDHVILRADSPFDLEKLKSETKGGIAWIEEHDGVIRTMEDVENFPWPGGKIRKGLAEALITNLPEDMGGIIFSGGVLEWATVLVGMERFMLGLYDSPDLIKAVVDRVGESILEYFSLFVSEEKVVAFWLGDDMGYKNGPLIKPGHIKDLILPWHKRYADLAHESGKPFILHSCGNIECLMPDLIEYVGIDARHSFEDAVTPAKEAKRKWGSRVAILGGLDVDILSRKTPEEVEKRTFQLLEECAAEGGYAAGSGNSIPDYVPAENYLSLLRAVRLFNRDF